MIANMATVPGERRMTNLAPLTDKQLRDAERDKVYIFNVGLREHKPFVGKQYTIPACKPTERVSEALEIPGVVYQTNVRSGEGWTREYEWVGTDGIDVARDIVGTAAFKDASENLTPLGVFISLTSVAAEADINKATELWLAYCDRKVREADEAYAVNNGMVVVNGRSMSNISKDAIEACRVLGLQRPWADRNQRLELCDECGTGNLPTAAFCKACDNMLNAEAAKRKFPTKYTERMGITAEAPERRGPGRPRNVEVGA